MNWVARACRSSIGAKVVMAVTGAMLLLFLLAHLLGNLTLFGGPEKMNHYAQSLRDLGPLLWVARIGLLAVALVHVFTALRLIKANESARPIAYLKQASRQVKPQTKYMATTGLALLAYALFHLAHFTWGAIYPGYAHGEAKLADGRVVHDVYSMVVHGFSEWWVSAAYLAAMVCLALHLCHGVSSACQTLGLNNAKYQRAIKLAGPAVATLFFLGYASLPIAVLLGMVALPGGAS